MPVIPETFGLEEALMSIISKNSLFPKDGLIVHIPLLDRSWQYGDRWWERDQFKPTPLYFPSPEEAVRKTWIISSNGFCNDAPIPRTKVESAREFVYTIYRGVFTPALSMRFWGGIQKMIHLRFVEMDLLRGGFARCRVTCLCSCQMEEGCRKNN